MMATFTLANESGNGDELTPEKRRAAEEAADRTAEHMHVEDVSDAASDGRKKVERLDNKPPGPLETLWEDVKTLISILDDYRSGVYRDISWTAVAKIAAAIVYFVTPIDVIPDIVPVAGYLDDAAVLGLCLRAVKDEIERYRAWKRRT